MIRCDRCGASRRPVMEVGDDETLCLGCLADKYEQVKGERDALKEEKALLLRSIGTTSDAHTLMPRELVTDLRELIGYNWADELDDYRFNNMDDEEESADEESIKAQARKSEHILGSMVRLTDWLESLAEAPAV